MAKYTIIAVSALCFLTFFGTALSVERFYIEGTVYCDTCRIQNPTRISENMAGATVVVDCKQENGTITFTKLAVTDKSGSYRVEVDGDHEEEVCVVTLSTSTRPDCNYLDSETHFTEVVITKNNGTVSPVCTASPLGFMIKERLPECAKVFKELGLDADGASHANDGNDRK